MSKKYKHIYNETVSDFQSQSFIIDIRRVLSIQTWLNLVVWTSYFFLLLSGVRTEAQFIVNDPNALMQNESLDSMLKQGQNLADKMRNTKVDFQYFNIINYRNIWHLLPDGHFDVFVWKDGKWQNTYRKDDLGYNFFSTKFLFDDRIYSYGGYGFWRLNSDIIYFEPELSEWALSKEYTNVPFGVGIPGHDQLIIFSGNQLSMLDLNSSEISTCTIEILTQFQLRNPDFRLSGKSFTVFLEENLQLLIEKPNNNIYTLKKGALSKVHLLSKKDCIHIKGDSIIAYNPDFIEIFRESLNVNFDEYTEAKCLKDKKYFAKTYLIAILICIAGLILAVIMYFKRQTNKPVEQVSIVDLHENYTLYDKISKAGGSTLTQDELDILFDIHNEISPGNKRFKRANLISEINSKSKLLHSKEKILRIKDPHDKRKYLYYIER